jgi:hypothetical protein
MVAVTDGMRKLARDMEGLESGAGCRGADWIGRLSATLNDSTKVEFCPDGNWEVEYPDGHKIRND